MVVDNNTPDGDNDINDFYDDWEKEPVMFACNLISQNY